MTNFSVGGDRITRIALVKLIISQISVNSINFDTILKRQLFHVLLTINPSKIVFVYCKFVYVHVRVYELVDFTILFYYKSLEQYTYKL